MEKIIRGKRYNTDAATEITRTEDQALYQKRTGEFFLLGLESETIFPITYTAAAEWARDRISDSLYLALFGKPSHAGKKKTISLTLPEGAIAQLTQLASMTGRSRSDLLTEMISRYSAMPSQRFTVMEYTITTDDVRRVRNRAAADSPELVTGSRIIEVLDDAYEALGVMMSTTPELTISNSFGKGETYVFKQAQMSLTVNGIAICSQWQPPYFEVFLEDETETDSYFDNLSDALDCLESCEDDGFHARLMLGDSCLYSV